MNAYDFTLYPPVKQNWNLPDVMPQNLYAGEYLMLAEHYLSNWNYRQAAKCIAKVKKLAPGTELEKTALYLEKYQLFTDDQFKKWVAVMKLKGDPEKVNQKKHLKAVRQFLVEFPNCQCALEELHQYLDEGDERKNIRLRLEPFDPQACPAPFVDCDNKINLADHVARILGEFTALLNGGHPGSRQRAKSKEGFIDRTGRFVFHAEDPVRCNDDFSEGFSTANSSGFYNIKGVKLNPPDVSRLLRFCEGLAPVKVNDYWGFIDTKGQMAIKPDLQFALWFKDGLAPVKVDGKWGYLNKANKMAIKPQFQGALNFQEDLAAVAINNKTGYINKSGKLVIPAIYDAGESFSNGLAKVVNLETPINRLHVYYIDKKGNRVFDLNSLRLKYDKYGQYLHFEQDNELRSDYFNLVGAYGDSNPDVWNLTPNHGFPKANQFNDDRLLVDLAGMSGYVDTKGRLIIPANYYKARPFSEGLAAVSTDPLPSQGRGLARQRYGFIDKNGKFVIAMKYEEVGDFHEGLAYVRITDGIGGFIDTTGKLIIQFEGWSSRFKEGVAPVSWQDPIYFNR